MTQNAAMAILLVGMLLFVVSVVSLISKREKQLMARPVDGIDWWNRIRWVLRAK
jgi:hypothetical protein